VTFLPQLHLSVVWLEGLATWIRTNDLRALIRTRDSRTRRTSANLHTATYCAYT